MIGGVLQDRTTVRGVGGNPATIPSIVQSSTCYVDLGDVDDLILFLDVREFTNPAGMGVVQLVYETSPTHEDASFVPLFPAFALSITTSPRVDLIYCAYAAVPVARYLRWRITVNPGGTGTYDACFRITYAGYAAGA